MNNYLFNDSLANCLDKIIDYRGKTPKKLGGDWSSSGYRALSANNVKFEGIVKQEDIRFLDETMYLKWMKEEIKRGDLLLTSEAPAGQVMLWDSDEKIVLSQRLYGLRVKKHIDNRYLKYYLQSNIGQKEIFKNNSGSTVFGISALTFSNIIVRYPKLNLQQKIASVLSALDAKIELNNRISAVLEAMAKTIYDYWFVQFDFPDENGKPFKSTGGKMVYNKQLKREIPAGWEVENISNCCSVIDCLHSQKPISKYEDDRYYLLQLENIRNDGLLDLSTKYYVSKENYDKWTSNIEITENDIVITNAGRIAATAQIPKSVSAGIGRNITAIRPNTISPTYLFYALRGADLRRQIIWNTDNGAFFNSLNVKGIKNLFIPRSPKNIEEKFELLAYSFRRQREIMNEENQHLSQLRDWLLPMLMNGQVTIKDAENIINETSKAAEPTIKYRDK